MKRMVPVVFFHELKSMDDMWSLLLDGPQVEISIVTQRNQEALEVENHVHFFILLGN